MGNNGFPYYYSGKLIKSKYIALVGEWLSFSERNVNPHFS